MVNVLRPGSSVGPKADPVKPGGFAAPAYNVWPVSAAGMRTPGSSPTICGIATRNWVPASSSPSGWLR